MLGHSGVGRRHYIATTIGALLGLTGLALATEIEGTQPFAMGQPRVDMSVRREPEGTRLVSGRGIGKTINMKALLDMAPPP